MLLINLSVKAQLKIFSAGTISLGSATSPLSGTRVQVFGNSVYTLTSGTPTSAAYIRGLNAYSDSTNPDYTWYNNDQVGIYHPASNTIGFTTSGRTRMRINSSGNVQINTKTLDNANLNIYNYRTGNQCGIYMDINQNADWVHTMTTRCNRNYSVNYDVNLNGVDKFYVTGDGTAFAVQYGTLSDISLKDNIVTITDALNKVIQLRGVNFNYKPDNLSDLGNNGPVTPQPLKMGLIAQEVEQIVPEVVITSKDGLKAVAYQNLVGLLIEAIKEQNTKIVQLEQDINACCATNKSKLNGTNPNGEIELNNEKYKSDFNENDKAKLYQNKPNPFNSQTEINYYVPANCLQFSIIIFDMQGKLLKTITLDQKGDGSIKINAGSLYPGMFLYTLMVDTKEIDTKRMILTQ